MDVIHEEEAEAATVEEQWRFRLTPERKADLDRQWFGARESVAKPLTHKHPNFPGGAQVTTSCGYCGEVMTLPQAEHNKRLRESRSGKVYCSRACGASSRGMDA